MICWFVYIGKKCPVYGVLDINLHTRLAIVTENELGLAFPPRNLPKKFCLDPSTFYLVIVVTNKQTDKLTPVITQALANAFAGITNRQTNAGDSIIPRFRWYNKWMLQLGPS